MVAMADGNMCGRINWVLFDSIDPFLSFQFPLFSAATTTTQQRNQQVAPSEGSERSWLAGREN